MPRRSTIISGGSTYASGNGTNNAIPKGNGAGKLADSALTDNGTTVTSTEPLISPSGTAALPGFGIGATNNGFSKLSGGAAYSNASADSNPMFLMGLSNVEAFRLGSTKSIGWASGTDPNVNSNDTFLGRRAVASFRLGAADVNGVPVSQTVTVQNAITGSDLAGATFTIEAPLGTGAGAGAKTVINRTLMKGTGTTAQTSVNGFIIGESKTLSNTSATATSLANISVPSNSGGGCWGSITVVATDGTNFDSETQSFNVSYVNKAGAMTVGTPVITATTAANNSGSATIGMTAVAGTNSVDIKVTPVFTTIVPTTVTAYITLINNGTGNVTIN